MLTEELMQKVRQLEIYTSRAVSEVFSGEYSSAFKGRGMEFAEVREYEPGDDIRTIDWNVTARHDAPYVKRFVEERELTIVLLVDLSASGAFGTVQRPKNETAAELCAVLAFAAIRNNDKVGLLVFTDHVEHYIPPKKGKNHVLGIIRELLDFEPRRGGTDLTGALEHLSSVQRRSAVVFLVSDFLAPETDPRDERSAAFERALRHAGRRHDVIALNIADPAERRLPRAGLVEFEDAETGRRVVLDTSSRRVRQRYEIEAKRRDDALRSMLRRCRVDSVAIETGQEYIQTLMNLFRRRERRR